MKVLISGVGVAGPTLAYWLSQQGIAVTLVERAPRLRTGGYVVDFWGLGFEVAERMGRIPELKQKGYRVREVRLVDSIGRRVGGFSAAAVFGRLTGERYLSIARGELAACLYGSVENRVETIFGDSITAGKAAAAIWQLRLGVPTDPPCARLQRGPLFRSRQSDPDARLDAGPGGPGWRCSFLRLVAGRAGSGPGHDGRLRAGRKPSTVTRAGWRRSSRGSRRRQSASVGSSRPARNYSCSCTTR
jgi:choline dehydrogenase-like flavoprotein